MKVDKDTSYAHLGAEELKLIQSLEETLNGHRQDGERLMLIAYQSPQVR
jgi:hypothetical protein